MVNEMVETHTPQHIVTWHGHQNLVALLERPWPVQLIVAQSGQGLARLASELAVQLHQIRVLLNFWWTGIRTRNVQFLRGAHRDYESWQTGNVPGHPAERAGFLMGLPVPFVFGDALQRLLGGVQVALEFTDQ